jgi:hypothetical protein
LRNIKGIGGRNNSTTARQFDLARSLFKLRPCCRQHIWNTVGNHVLAKVSVRGLYIDTCSVPLLLNVESAKTKVAATLTPTNLTCSNAGIVDATRREGLCEDYDTVKAGMTLPWSNGPVEGQINRLKMLKRQMYGRAKIELLSQRFLLAA